jgi:hypothetical protein
MKMLLIDFRPGGNARQFLRDGWSFQERVGIWAIGPESSLSMPPVSTAGPHRLSIKVFPMIRPPNVPYQRVELRVNGQALHNQKLGAGERQIDCVIPQGLLHTTTNNELVVSHPDATAPSRILLQSADSRPLALCFERLELDHLEAHDSLSSGTPTQAQDSSAGVDKARPLIICFGGADGCEIAGILRSFPPFDTAFELRFVKGVVSCTAMLNALSSRDRTRLVGVWEQVSIANEDKRFDFQNYSFSSAVHIRFPRLSLHCLWPLQGHDPRLTAESLYPGGRYPYTDIAGVHLHSNSLNLDDDDLYNAYLKLSTSLMPDLADQWKLDESRWLALDSCCDVKVASFIKTNFARQRLFYSPDMPGAPLLIYIAEHLMGSLLPRTQFQPSELYREFSSYVHGYQGMFYDQAPIHPCVLDAFKVPGLSAEFEYRREFSKRTFREHILDYIRWAPWFAGGRAKGE